MVFLRQKSDVDLPGGLHHSCGGQSELTAATRVENSFQAECSLLTVWMKSEAQKTWQSSKNI